MEAGSRYVIYIGSENEELKDTVSQWCLYTKNGMAEYAQVADCPELPEVLPQMIVLESGSYQTAEDIAKIRQMAEKGAGIVFSEVEQSVLAESEELAKLLGIEHIVAEETQISGIKIFEEFFLGGEVTYQAQNEQEAEENQDLNLNVPWYIPGSGTKVYMVGLMQGTDVKNENLPALIWKCGRKGKGIRSLRKLSGQQYRNRHTGWHTDGNAGIYYLSGGKCTESFRGKFPGLCIGE